MITREQKKWLSQLSNTKIVEIVPYDPKVKSVFEKVKQEIQSFMNGAQVIHRGSTALGIAGQGEIDLYIPVLKNNFDKNLKKLIIHFGEPGSIYPFKRARFVKYIDNTKIEIFLINKEDENYKNSVKFENYLKENPESLKKYEELKRESNGLTVQEYYRIKIEFINGILAKL